MSDEKRLHTLFTDADSRRQRIRDHVMEGIEDTFPLDGKHFRIELDKFHIKPEKFSPSQQKKALLEKSTMVEPIKGTLRLIDKETGETVQESKRTLAHVPYLTERHTFIMSGNEYSVSNQVRIKPGVYTRKRGNGELEASFNLARGKNFRLMMDPERGIIFMQYASSKIPLYPILKALGISHSKISQRWGGELARLNQNFAAGKEDKYLRKLYNKAIPHYNRESSPDRDTIIKAIKDTYEQTAMDGSVNKLTLGEKHNKVNAPALLRASQKLVRVYNGKERQDDRDSLAFKTLHTAESFMKERIEKDASPDLRRKAIRKLNQKKRNPKMSDMMPTSPFTKSIHRFLKTSALANTPMQINPIEMLDSATKVTALGEGGISSTLAVPDEARDVHHSHLGFMDPIRTPESQKAGIDIRGSLHLARDDDGNMYTPVVNTKTGKGEYVSADKLMRSNVAFPGQDLKLRKKQKKTVDIIDGTGKVRAADPDEAEYQVPYAASMYGPSTNLVPMLNNAMGNRNIMGSKFQTQAVPLLEREEPLVQVESWQKGRSVEQEFGEMISPVATEDGTIEDIDEDFIYIRPDRRKKASYELHTPKPRAIIVQGNPRYIRGNPKAKRYYEKIEKYLERKGFDVEFDAGAPYTQPEEAALWVGHSRGVDRLRFAPPMTRTLAFGSLVDGAINHPVDQQKLEEFDAEEGHEYDPPDEHYKFTPEQKAAIDRVTGTVKTAATRTTVEVEDDGRVKIPYSTNFPMASKTYLHDELNVKKGQKVKKGQSLGENNFTRGNKLALGTNLNVAYVPYYGKNSNDAVVISEHAAKKLTSTHMYTENISIDHMTVLDKEKHKNYFGTKYSRNQYNRLDKRGIIREGQKVEQGELLIAAMRENQARADAQLLGKLHRSLVKPYRDAAVVWEHHFTGVVTDVSVTENNVTVAVKTDEPMQVGDKLANRFGGKGVVSEIVPDDQMMKDEGGNVVDVALTSAGIITRTNPNQILETAVAKVAKKTGQPITVPQYVKDGTEKDRVKWAKNLLKKHNLRDKETILDPRSGKKIPNIMVGPQYTFKMFKSADTNYAARGVGPGYDANLQPTKGGDEGAKSVGKMEFNALVAHNARNVLNEVSNVKSQRSDEFWRRVQLGLPTQTPNDNFAFNKFKDTLTGAGINMKKNGTKWSLGPITDRDVDKMASGTVKNPLLVKTQATKDGQKIVTEKGGLFDPVITGGMTGTKYSKIDLAEPVVNPIFEEPVRRLLGMSQKEFKKARDEQGADRLKQKLNALNLDQKLKELRKRAKTRKGSARNDAIKQIKYIQALKKEGLQAGDAYVLTKVPVTPPTVRPIMPNPDGTTLVSDSNYLYRDLMLANQSMSETPDELKDFDFQKSQRQHLHDAVGALFGVNDPVSPQNKGRGVKGHLQQVTGTSSPKNGYFQSRLMKRRQDLSGRATIAPDHTLGLDEVGIPENMAWKMYEPFLIKELIRKGHSAVKAREMVQDKAPAAKRILDVEVKKRPVMINRAPTLHRYNMISAYPKLVPGKTMRINPFAEAGMNADYDGDALQVHTPVSDAAVNEAKGMTLSNLVFGDRSKDDLMVFPAHEAIIGTYMATKDSSNKKPMKFKSKAEAMKAYKAGKIKLSDPVEIEGF